MTKPSTEHLGGVAVWRCSVAQGIEKCSEPSAMAWEKLILSGAEPDSKWSLG